MSYKSCAFSENVRPLIVLAALAWLIKHSDLYKNTNIALYPDCKRTVTESKSDEADEIMTRFFPIENFSCKFFLIQY